MYRARFILFIAVVLTAGGCSQTVQPRGDNLGSVTQGTIPTSRESALANASQEDSAARLQMEAQISEGCVKAWRTAMSGDTDGSLRQLDQLAKTYPSVGTISMMRGQILQHAGRKQEALQAYKQAVSTNEYSSLGTFKYAEALRTTGDAPKAVDEYHRLLKSAPEFVPGKIGLAQALYALDKKSAEAKTQLQESIKLEPNNAEAKSLLARMSKK